MCQIMKLTWLMLLSRLILALGDYPNSSASCKSSEPFSTQLRMVMVLQDRWRPCSPSLLRWQPWKGKKI
jgi:hypothetical protein